MNSFDYIVLFTTLLGIAGYGIWSTRDRRTLGTYLRGDGTMRWATIGLSVMATQASAITFLSTPGQGFEQGLGFVQNYFGLPLALIVVAAVFLPLFRKLDVYTAYEFLGKRFDAKTRLLGAGLFLLQRGLAAGITIYAPAIVLSAVFGWRLDLTILVSGLVVIAYTAAGGTDAVSITQKYQMGIIFAGMAAAFFIAVKKLAPIASVGDTLAVAGALGKLQAVNLSLDIHQPYTLWSGLFGGFFLSLSYFGTDQSQVQRYLSGSTLKDSRLGLMFNAVLKIPMQFFILLLGVFVFVFYQVSPAPAIFNRASVGGQAPGPAADLFSAAEATFASLHQKEAQGIHAWLAAKHAEENAGGGAASAARQATEQARKDTIAWHDRAEAARVRARDALKAASPHATTNDTDYVFITFVVEQLPHGLVGLLVAVFFAAALSSKAAELNALGSTTTVDIYRHLVKTGASDRHYVVVSKLLTIFWGFAALGFALSAHLAENLIQAINILGSLFYGVVLGLFLVAFFLRRVGGTAVFWGALVAECLVLVLYFATGIGYLWYNLIGCVACASFAALLEEILPSPHARPIPS